MRTINAKRSFKGVLLGAMAGAVGTSAMDLVWFRRFRRGGGQSGLYEWETGKGIVGWENASDPGKVGHLILQKLSRHEIDNHWARPATNAVHWATGLLWGAQFGLLVSALPHRRLQLDLLIGPAAWISSYAILPLLEVYKPVWQYDARTLEKDFTAHIVFGSVTALTYAILTRSRDN